MKLVFRPVVWVTLDKASEYTGRSVDSFRHLIRDGKLVEGTHWKWSPDNRQHINLEGYDEWVATSNSTGVRAREASIFIDVRWNGVSYRESIALNPTVVNLRAAARMRDENGSRRGLAEPGPVRTHPAKGPHISG